MTFQCITNPAVGNGSSLRGAMTDLYNHGISRARLWSGIDMPPA